MNKSKSNFATVTAEPSDAFDSQGNVKAILRIDGLVPYQYDEVTGVHTFEMSGLSRRQIDYKVLLDALGFSDEERELPQTTVLVETIDRAVQDHDLIQLLTKRVKFLG